MNGAVSVMLTPTSTEMSWDGKIRHGLWFCGGVRREGVREYLTRWIVRRCQ